jgi:hypothetical protein
MRKCWKNRESEIAKKVFVSHIFEKLQNTYSQAKKILNVSEKANILEV